MCFKQYIKDFSNSKVVSETEDRENKLDREVGRTKYGNFGLEKFRLVQQGEEIKSSKFIHWENDARKKGWVQEHWELVNNIQEVIVLHIHTR